MAYKSIVAFFVLMMLASVLLLIDSYQNVKFTHAQARDVIKQQQAKHRLLTRMYSAASERSLLLHRMYAEEDPFVLDDLNQGLGAYARDFIKARLELSSMPLGEGEEDILLELYEAVNTYGPSQNQAAELLIEGRREQAELLLFEKAISGQAVVLSLISDMLELYEKNSLVTVADMDKSFQQAGKNYQMLGADLLGTSALFILFTIYISRRERTRLQAMLAEQKRISEQLDHSTEKLSHQATHDSLTGLINRREFENHLKQLLQRSEEGNTHVVFYLDLDQFKIVNDSCGHYAGDELLREISAIMQPYMRESDVLARLGGDEFGVILEYCELNLAENIAQSIIEAVNSFRFRWEGKTFRVGVSIGMVQINDALINFDDVMMHIDSACYAAKDAGRNRYHLYLESDKELARRRSEMDWAVRLDRALEEKRFVLYAQPIVSINKQISSRPNYEILIRMQSKEGEIISPDAFLSAAERYNKMINIDRWVVEEAVSRLAANQQFLQQIDYCSINLSCPSLTDTDFLDFIIDLFSAYKGLAGKICFEITETAAIINMLQASRHIAILRSMGLRFALDDFGSGLSSFEYLKTLPIDYLKIDGMFVRDIVTDPIDRAMVKSIHEIASVMDKKTVAEYVESSAILDELKAIGVDYVQGYEIGMPSPLSGIIGVQSKQSSSKVISFPGK
ncbi:MAG: EAL domain-containing protein [Gammaproteobacteria bacterium]|nr:EAL domain-containing protein [Gammaproteobacteria bacterium]